MKLLQHESKDIYCLIDGEKKKFIPILDINNDSIFNLSNNISISDLKDKMVYGKIIGKIEVGGNIFILKKKIYLIKN